VTGLLQLHQNNNTTLVIVADHCHSSIMCLYVLSSMWFVFVQWCPKHIVLCFCFVFLRLVCPMLPISLDYPLLIASSVLSNVYSLMKPSLFSVDIYMYLRHRYTEDTCQRFLLKKINVEYFNVEIIVVNPRMTTLRLISTHHNHVSITPHSSWFKHPTSPNPPWKKKAKATKSYRLSRQDLEKLYLVYIRPIFEYACDMG
jgi:hypothetical protein